MLNELFSFQVWNNGKKKVLEYSGYQIFPWKKQKSVPKASLYNLLHHKFVIHF